MFNLCFWPSILGFLLLLWKFITCLLFHRKIDSIFHDHPVLSFSPLNSKINIFFQFLTWRIIHFFIFLFYLLNFKSVDSNCLKIASLFVVFYFKQLCLMNFSFFINFMLKLHLARPTFKFSSSYFILILDIENWSK